MLGSSGAHGSCTCTSSSDDAWQLPSAQLKGGDSATSQGAHLHWQHNGHCGCKQQIAKLGGPSLATQEKVRREEVHICKQ